MLQRIWLEIGLVIVRWFVRYDIIEDCRGKYDRLIDKILRGTSDANISFDDLRVLLIRLGFDERIRGSHHLYRKEGIEEKLNLQRDGSKAKPYQVRQVRLTILKYHLASEE